MKGLYFMLKGQKMGEKSGIFMNCETCGKSKYVYKYQLKTQRKIFCNFQCMGKYQEGKPTWLSINAKKGISMNTGRTQFKKGMIPMIHKVYSGKDHYKWQEKPNYAAVHAWIVKIYGKAKSCSFDSTHQSTRYEWANISGSYLRDVNDFAQLCKKCHNEYDWIRRGKPLNRKGGRFLCV